MQLLFIALLICKLKLFFFFVASEFLPSSLQSEEEKWHDDGHRRLGEQQLLPERWLPCQPGAENVCFYICVSYIHLRYDRQGMESKC